MPLDGYFDITVTRNVVNFVFTVENGGTNPVDLAFRSGKVADVVVYESGTEVWRWSDGRLFTQALGTETLDPGQSFTHEVAWEEPPPGEYVAEASLDARNVSLVERNAFEIRA